MTYAVYLRYSNRHKWRLVSVYLDKKLAVWQARHLAEQAHARGYGETQTKVSSALKSAYHAPSSTWKVP